MIGYLEIKKRSRPLVILNSSLIRGILNEILKQSNESRKLSHKRNTSGATHVTKNVTHLKGQHVKAKRI